MLLCIFYSPQALDIYRVIKDLTSLEETKCVCHFLFQLSLFKDQWRFSMPALHSALLERLVNLMGSTAAVVSCRSTLKQIVRTMSASGLLDPQDASLQTKGRRGGGVGSEDTPSTTSLSWAHDA